MLGFVSRDTAVGKISRQESVGYGIDNEKIPELCWHVCFAAKAEHECCRISSYK